MANKSYNDIDSLGNIEHIQLRPDMYIGTTETPHHLLEEVLDNAFDEALQNHVSEITINITKDNEVIISDNGRGIPLNKKQGKYIPNLVCTKLHTSGKFNIKTKAYDISAGLHGIGLVAVNALSSSLEIEILRENKKGIFNFSLGTCNNETVTKFKSKTTGTIIKFKPSKKFFRNLEFDKDKIIKRCWLILCNKPDLNIILNFKDELINIKRLNIDEILNEEFKSNFTNSISKFINVKHVDGIRSVECSLIYDYKRSESLGRGSINLLPCNDGTHIKSFQSLLIDVWSSFFNFKKIGIQPKDVLCGSRIYVNLLKRNSRYLKLILKNS